MAAEGAAVAETAVAMAVGAGVALVPGSEENSLIRISVPNHPANRSEWLVVTARARPHPTRQTNTSEPELRFEGRAEKATHSPSAEN